MSLNEFLPITILLLAAFVHGAFGFGFPLIATPLLSLFFELPTAILMTLVPTVSINTASILGEPHWRQALRRYWLIPSFTIVGSLLGTQLLLSVDPAPFRALLAAVLIVYLLTERLHRSEHPIEVPAWVMALFGLGLGLMAGVVNVFAPLMVLFALYTRMAPALVVATFNLSFLTSKSGQIIGFIGNGAFDPAVVMPTVWLLPLILVSLWLGICLRRRFPVAQYKNVLRVFLWLIALVLMADWVMGFSNP